MARQHRLRPSADPVPRHGHRSGHRRRRGARPRLAGPGDACQHGRARPVRADRGGRPHAGGRRPGQQPAGAAGARHGRGHRHRRQHRVGPAAAGRPRFTRRGDGADDHHPGRPERARAEGTVASQRCAARTTLDRPVVHRLCQGPAGRACWRGGCRRRAGEAGGPVAVAAGVRGLSRGAPPAGQARRGHAHRRHRGHDQRAGAGGARAPAAQRA